MTYPTKKLGEICDINGGDAAPQDYAVFSSDGVPFVRMQDLGRYHVTDNLIETRDKIKTEAINKLGIKIFPKGSIILPRSGSVFANHRAVLGVDAAVVSHIAILNNYKGVEPRYLFWYLTKLDIGRHAVKTSNVDSISFQRLGKFEIPIPPLAIQKQIVERLDKIAEAQKLNEELIQKTNELFQSLLHQELNPAGSADAKAMTGKKDWEVKKLKEILSSEKYKVGKLKREAYRESGEFPIIDQSVNNIAGYSDEKDLVYSGILPLVIYGDHTRIVKFIDKPFILGADGTKILIPNNEVLAEYLYFALQLFNIGGQGYKRHFPILKEVKIPIPPLKTQKQIVAKLSAVQGYKTQLLAQRAKLKELFDSALHKSMSGEYKKSKFTPLDTKLSDGAQRPH